MLRNRWFVAEDKGGEDAGFISANRSTVGASRVRVGASVRWAHAGCVAALADGVGGWASQGVDAGVYSKTVWLGSLVGTSRDIERDVAVLCS